MKWYLLGFKNYLKFTGRAVRKEFWMFMLINLLILIAAMIIDQTYNLTLYNLPVGYTVFSLIAVILIPTVAVTIRRLHDLGNKGWVLLLTLLPVIGVLWILTLLVKDSYPDENMYGTSPKYDKGSPLHKEFSSDVLILILVGWMLLVRSYYFIMLRYFPDFYASKTFAISNKFIALIWAVVPLSMAFAIKDKYIQFVIFCAGGIYLIYGLYSIVVQLL